MEAKTIFLDRDGVINHDPGHYTMSVDEFEFLPGVLERLKEWSDLGYSIVVVTNQGGIAKGLYNVADFEKIDQHMARQFRSAGIAYLDTYFCPHHQDFGRCLCRKPLPGMMEKAIARHRVDRQRSVMIGDKERDIACAAAAGVKGILVPVNGDLRRVDLSSAK